MDPLIQDFEFLDLTDINDSELEHLHNVLYATEPNPNAKYPELPWVEPIYDEEVSMNGEPEDVPPLNSNVPPYPTSSGHQPVTMYQVMAPPVYVNNLTATVSVHPYMGYHALYQPQDSQSPRPRRTKSNNKSRDYRNIDPNLESPNAGGQIPQGYSAGPFIPVAHHSHYYTAAPPPPSAQHATGTPLYTMPMQSHVPMYPQPPMYPYHPSTIYSHIDHSPYTEVPVKENISYPPPEKLHTYDYNAQNRMKDNIPPVQYQPDASNDVYSQETSYNNQNNEINTNSVSKEPIPVVQYQPNVEVVNYNNPSVAVLSQNITKEAPVNDISVKAESPSVTNDSSIQNATLKMDTPKAAVISYINGQHNGVDHDNVSPKSTMIIQSIKPVENQVVKQDSKKVDIKPVSEVKMEGAVKYVGGVIVSELKTDAQVFRPASSKNIAVPPQAPKDKSPINSGARSVVSQTKVEPVSPNTTVVQAKPTQDVQQQHTNSSVVEDPKPSQYLPNATVAREDVKTSTLTTPAHNATQSTPESAAAVNTPTWGKASWASLFQKNSGPADQDPNANRLVARVEPFHEARDSPVASARAVADARRTQLQCQDPHLYRLGEFLCKYELEHKSVSLLPRGLTNRSNWCYINSILQSLLACPPFYNLMKALPAPRKNQKSTTPILDSIVQFVNEFLPLSSVTRSRKERSFRKEDGSMDVQTGPSFEPAYIYKMLNNIRSDTFKVEGRQEDAEEFLSCLLNALNDEMMEVMKLVQDTETEQQQAAPVANGTDATAGQDDSDSEWKVMGPKNKGSITRRADFGRTPISDIFRGHLRSRVQRAGDQSTDNVQPFFTLQLDIEKSQSVREALELLVGRDQLEGVTCSKTNQEVEAWQQVTLEDLPTVLVLHLKWFDYKLDGCSKIVKTVEFPIELKVDSKLMSSSSAKKYTLKQKQYKLFAVVYHDGKEATKGHYVTDVFHVGYGGWIRYDDSTVRTVQETTVLHPRIPRVPYLLYYRRCDTIGNQTPIR